MSNEKNQLSYRGLLVGAGYFSQFHMDAWKRLDRATIVAICDLDKQKARDSADRFGIEQVYSNLDDALSDHDFDFVDMATPPNERLPLVRRIIDAKLALICQKPLANDFETAQKIIALANSSSSTVMVHENFRFQPWYRKIKELLQENQIGKQLHSISMNTRLGDGWGKDAYLGRQPYFRTMPRLLIHETGVHFVDTFRYLAEDFCGEVIECSAHLRQLNSNIVGEDSGLMRLVFADGTEATWNANRYNESRFENARYTFGVLTIEAEGGSIWLDHDGTLHIKRLGQPVETIDFEASTEGFAGDCVYACQEHFLEVLDGKVSCETSPEQYEKSLDIVEAIYRSAELNRPVAIKKGFGRIQDDQVVQRMHYSSSKSEPTARTVIDLSLPVSNQMRGVEITTAKTISGEGWNATTLQLYSHAGTHMDAPKHFLEGGMSLERHNLANCVGPARLVDLTPVEPRQLITVEAFMARCPSLAEGERILLRTDWYRRFGQDDYRDELPRISLELAHWFVAQKVALIGVEPPSVADVNNIEELTHVHQVLFRGDIIIVEGLANLDQLTNDEFEFIALPLRVVDGDGCPVRAIAIEGEAH